MKSAKPLTKAPRRKAVVGTTVALKIQRTCYPAEALSEIGLHHFLRREKGPCPDLIDMIEAFAHEGHLCTAYELHGRSLDTVVARSPLAVEPLKCLTRQLLRALNHLHTSGYIHADVKPENVLYRSSPKPQARLSDIGGARPQLSQGASIGTRDYLPPEAILGQALGPAVDLWALACTLFLAATGQRLFHPRQAAEGKYVELNEELPDDAYDPSFHADAAAETAEQYRSGTLIAGKYRLISRLGQGRFATVWRAIEEHPITLDGSYETLTAMPVLAPDDPPEHHSTPDAASAWRSRRGAEDLHDLVINYEHLVLMQELLGPPPARWASQGRYADTYCDPTGHLKHDPPPCTTVSLAQRLTEAHVPPPAAEAFAAFLRSLLTWHPADRPSAAACLRHPWLSA